ncbi:MAG: chemotaxis protein CheA [Gammaproteobacteria bacterium]
MNFDDVLPAFVAEASELLREMEDGLLQCTRGTPSDETINLIFRSAHTIKGSAGLFGLDAVVSFVHGVETLLDRVRLGEVALGPQLVQSLLNCKDHISVLVAGAPEAKHGVDPELLAQSARLLTELDESSGGAASQVKPTDASGSTAAPGSSAAAAAPAEASAGGWKISLGFSQDVLLTGMDPLAFIRYLTTFGTIAKLVVLDADLPALSRLDAHKCYLGFEIELVTQEDRARVEAAFEFVRDDCSLKIEPLAAVIVASNTDRAAAPADAAARAGGAETGTDATAGTTNTASLLPTHTHPGTGAVTVAQADAGAGNTASASSARGRSARPASGAENTTVRVDAARLDSLITRIGELIIAAAGASTAARRSECSEVEESLSVLTSLVEEVRGGALQLRMVKIGDTFNRFGRVVHDVSRELGKEIQLQVSGEDTELDKTLVERIADPLTHLVRNAIDHGIEPADVRAERGKPAAGVVKLNAYHDSGTIVIEVSDDGGGLKRERILAKAQERGLIDAGRTLTEAEIFNLIFEPGFSTADQVTSISGRGVGMDVVKRNIAALRGEVSIRSAEGVGTTISVRLPLTLAIINGFQIGLGESMFVLPLESIEECVEFTSEAGHDFTSLRGEVLPFIQLRDIFSIKAPPARRQSIVVVRHAGQRAGLVVDALHGESQTVIKPLGRMFRKAECVSGSSILGTGDVALILDVAVLVRQAVVRERLALTA